MTYHSVGSAYAINKKEHVLSELRLSIFDRTIRVACEDAGLERLLLGVYGSLAVEQFADDQAPDLDYKVALGDSADKDRKYCIHRVGQHPIFSGDIGLFLYQFEKDMTIRLEEMRNDLYFLHAAALEYKGKIHLLVAESGGGKSTTGWALLHHGFNYASDELAPVELETMTVRVYPHALCQKTRPPEPYLLPDATLCNERTLHIPAEVLPCQVVTDSLPLKSIFFVRYDPEATSPAIKPVSAGEAGARIYANGLNQLAHPSDGLDAALEIAQHCHSFELQSAGLQDTCELVKALLDKDMSA